MNDCDFKELRTKLDIMGFNQTLPVLAIPLVKAIFGDLIKTTECLRDTKKQVADLLEEKSCWELGVEPYKCDNMRLIAECNALHMQVLRERDDYELRLCEADQKIRNLRSDCEHLQKHNQQLQSELDSFGLKQQINRVNPTTLRQTKKPFISTVRCGVMPMMSAASTISPSKCTKCNAGVIQKTTAVNKDGFNVAQTSAPEEINRLKNELRSVGEQLEFYKRKVESRNREIRRLCDLLSGGRPPAALAKDCCYKEVGALSKDVGNLQQEKCELMGQVSEYQNKMHDAMQRALRIEEEKQKLQMHLFELKEAALQMEQQANTEIDSKDAELRQLHIELDKMKQYIDKNLKAHRLTGGHEKPPVHNDKRVLNEKLNMLTRREEELETEIAKLKKKLIKVESKLAAAQKELREHMQQRSVSLDEEKIRLKSERDFFQKEYLRLVGKSGSDSEIAFLHAQIKSKDDELHALRSELCKATSVGHCDKQSSHTASNACGNSNSSDCVQAVIARVERERDCARVELERLRCERDTLREKQLNSVQMHAEELQALRLRNEDLQERIRQLERDYRELNSARVPTETHNVLLKEDVSELEQRVSMLQTEAENLRRENGQISLLNQQNEGLIADYQRKLLVAERQLKRADVRASTLQTTRETNRDEVTNLRGEIAALRQTFVTLESEKESLLNQLDRKTERVTQLEYEMKDSKEKRNILEQTVKELQSRLDKLTTRTRQCDSELFETSAESKTLRHHITALKVSHNEAIEENGRLMDMLSSAQVESDMLRQKLKDSEEKVDDMKKNLRQYVQEVKRADDMLMDMVYSDFKEKEREELLEQYHSLTNDQVTLADNNKSLKDEAAEFKSEICELECEISSLKNELYCRQCKIDDLEIELTAARASVRCLERELEIAREHKIELDVRKELCDKLDNEKEKLNAELNELNEIRKKLEREVEQLRGELQQKSEINRLTAEAADEMLVRIRGEQQRQDKAERSAKLELERLRKALADSVADLQRERERCNKQERLANKYEEQARELRKTLAEDRFCRARTREVSPRLKLQTSL